jgi:hypothetical protein
MSSSGSSVLLTAWTPPRLSDPRSDAQTPRPASRGRRSSCGSAAGTERPGRRVSVRSALARRGSLRLRHCPNRAGRDDRRVSRDRRRRTSQRLEISCHPQPRPNAAGRSRGRAHARLGSRAPAAGEASEIHGARQPGPDVHRIRQRRHPNGNRRRPRAVEAARPSARAKIVHRRASSYIAPAFGAPYVAWRARSRT